MGAVYEYFWVVFIHWWWLLTALLFGLDKFLEWVWPSYRDWLNRTFSLQTRRKFFWRTLFALALFSGFLAWKDKRTEVEEKQSEINQLTQAGTPGNIARLSQDLEQTRQANKQLEDQVARLQEKLRPWRIGKREEFVQALRAAGPSTLDLSCEADRDAEDLFEDLNGLLSAGRWVIRSRARVDGMSRRGVVIRVKDLHAPPPGAALLLRMLIQNEVVAELVPAQANNTRITTTIFSVEIGRRLEIGDVKGKPVS